MFERFFPDAYMESTYVIPFEKLYEEGVRGVIFDIDNTLVPHGAPADKRAKVLFKRLEQIGFSSCLISNNQEARVKLFNQDIGTNYIYNLVKPIHPKEEIQIVLKRYLEKLVLHFYNKKNV